MEKVNAIVTVPLDHYNKLIDIEKRFDEMIKNEVDKRNTELRKLMKDLISKNGISFYIYKKTGMYSSTLKKVIQSEINSDGVKMIKNALSQIKYTNDEFQALEDSDRTFSITGR